MAHEQNPSHALFSSSSVEIRLHPLPEPIRRGNIVTVKIDERACHEFALTGKLIMHEGIRPFPVAELRRYYKFDSFKVASLGRGYYNLSRGEGSSFDQG